MFLDWPKICNLVRLCDKRLPSHVIGNECRVCGEFLLLRTQSLLDTVSRLRQQGLSDYREANACGAPIIPNSRHERYSGIQMDATLDAQGEYCHLIWNQIF